MHKSTSLLNCKLLAVLGWVGLGQSADGLGWIKSHINGPVDNCGPSVCPIDRQQQRRPVGLLLSAGQQISSDSCGYEADAVLHAVNQNVRSSCGRIARSRLL